MLFSVNGAATTSLIICNLTKTLPNVVFIQAKAYYAFEPPSPQSLYSSNSTTSHIVRNGDHVHFCSAHTTSSRNKRDYAKWVRVVAIITFEIAICGNASIGYLQRIIRELRAQKPLGGTWVFQKALSPPKAFHPYFGATLSIDGSKHILKQEARDSTP